MSEETIEESALSKIANMVKEAQDAHSYSIRDTAERSGVSRGTVDNVLKARPVGHTKLLKIAESLQISTETIMRLLTGVPELPEDEEEQILAIVRTLGPDAVQGLVAAASPGADPELLSAVRMVLERRYRAIDIEAWAETFTEFHKLSAQMRELLDGTQSGTIKRKGTHSRKRPIKGAVAPPGPQATQQLETENGSEAPATSSN